ncbi:MAG TPA: YaaR family protein [Acetivibrio clariflavus]|nr:YaaR family protein [Acetivibrio clariflavus]HPU42379.1 YaaR family protein [Acetivibrio clariflavus]
MKIRDGLNSAANIAEVTGSEHKKSSNVSSNTFHSQLRKIEGQNLEERIKYLVDKITEQGQKLAKKVDVRELKIYKKLISEFLDEALNNSRKFLKESFVDRRGRYRVYAIIKKINSELDELTKDVLNTEKDNLRILQRIEDIRGLILDITM